MRTWRVIAEPVTYRIFLLPQIFAKHQLQCNTVVWEKFGVNKFSLDAKRGENYAYEKFLTTNK